MAYGGAEKGGAVAVCALAMLVGCGGGNSDSKPAASAGSAGMSSSGGGSSSAGSGSSSAGTGQVVGGPTTYSTDYTCPTPAPLSGTKPALAVGTWLNITPPSANVGATANATTFTNCIGVDPCDSNVIYTCTSGFTKDFQNVPAGVWKSTDAGGTWTKLADGVIDSPAGMAIGPNGHIFVTDGVRGNTIGFWRSDDGGMTWAQPDSFQTLSKDPTISTSDVSSIAVEPKNFKHVIVGYHSGWTDHGTYTNHAGIIESTDAGDSWTIHPPESSWTAGSQGVSFLFDPDKSVGDANTWLVAMDGAGFWRTTNAGSSWTQVSTTTVGHGGNDVYYSSAGVLYAGATDNILRSTDNGATFAPVSGNQAGGYYFTLIGDGTSMFAMADFDNGSANPFISSPEGDGNTWTKFNSQTFTRGPFKMAFDATNSIVYSASWEAGLWALKTK
ncbi:MAG TPA: hypothetical protein VHV51_25100 [Polyangiaceae bacterium]|jgi:hypothetical protein|nr:hypothetical protein [Polyangiaceae bacterium]